MSDSELVEVPAQDLAYIKSAISSAYYKSLAEDMVKHYHQLDDRGQNSPLTKVLEQALVLVTEHYPDPDE